MDDTTTTARYSETLDPVHLEYAMSFDIREAKAYFDDEGHQPAADTALLYDRALLLEEKADRLTADLADTKRQLGNLIHCMDWWAAQEDGLPGELAMEYTDARTTLGWEWGSDAHTASLVAYQSRRNEVDRLREANAALVTALEQALSWGWASGRGVDTEKIQEHRSKARAALALAAASHGDNDAAVDGALAAMEIGTQKRFGNRAIERRGVDSFDIADEADPQLPFLKGLSLAEAAAYIAKGPTT